jgi:hypothetical protein
MPRRSEEEPVEPLQAIADMLGRILSNGPQERTSIRYSAQDLPKFGATPEEDINVWFNAMELFLVLDSNLEILAKETCQS